MPFSRNIISYGRGLLEKVLGNILFFGNESFFTLCIILLIRVELFCSIVSLKMFTFHKVRSNVA